MLEFGQWRYSADRAATEAAYAREPAGAATTCTCVGCRNFVAVRSQIFPPRFVEFLESLGIDPAKKEAEAYHTARLAPGRHHYGGWYHFIGILEITGDFAPVDFGDGFPLVRPRLHNVQPNARGFATQQVTAHSRPISDGSVCSLSGCLRK